MTVFGIFAIILGILAIASARRRAARDRDERNGGDSRYAAEDRYLSAYPGMNRPQSMRLGGLFLIAVGLLTLAVQAAYARSRPSCPEPKAFPMRPDHIWHT